MDEETFGLLHVRIHSLLSPFSGVGDELSAGSTVKQGLLFVLAGRSVHAYRLK
jgi:hypothetical protein